MMLELTFISWYYWFPKPTSCITKPTNRSCVLHSLIKIIVSPCFTIFTSFWCKGKKWLKKHPKCWFRTLWNKKRISNFSIYVILILKTIFIRVFWYILGICYKVFKSFLAHFWEFVGSFRDILGGSAVGARPAFHMKTNKK